MLEIKNLCAGYGKYNVLRDVNLKVPKGKLISVIGINGSGKSTLLKSVAGIITPFSGQVIVDSHNAKTLKPTELSQKLAYLPQGRDLPDMTVEQFVLHGRFPYLGYPRRYSYGDYTVAKNAMEKMGICSFREKRLSSLSGGMRQKVYIAMALCQDTDYILLDEPTTYLDISHQIETMKILRSLADEGKGVATVMHDLALAFTFSHEIAVLHNDTIAYCDTPTALCKTDVVKEVFGVSIDYNKTENIYNYILKKEHSRF